MSELFTKTDYKNFLECGCYLWLSKNKKDFLPSPSASELFREKEGERVDVLAKQLFPTGVELATFNEEGWIASKKLIDEKTSVLFQPTIVAKSGLTCRADILTYDSKAKAWEIREVKSSTSVRPEDIQDVAFQLICFKEAGIPVSKMFLIHINNEYVKNGSIDPQKFFVTTDITDKVNEAVEEASNGIAVARGHLKHKAWPDARIIETCTNPKSCNYVKYYLQGVSDIQALADNLSPKYVTELLKRDIILLESLTEKYVNGLGYAPEEKYIDHAAIRGELKQLEYPLYFLDYETCASPIPKYDGTRPWQQIPFQYSLHIKKLKSAELEHKEFIATEDKNPIPDLALQLQKDIGEKGSIVVWNASFEATRNKEIAKSYPEYASVIESVNGRMFDLMVIFRKKLYTQHKFYRSYSIKNILPVLVPELSYKELTIQEGGTASISWPNLIDSKIPLAERAELKKDMLLYCGLDTLAMVRILENLEKEVE
jgi:CRISPR/Cas system-associated exonuclease Cas4 (RecB family)